MAFKLFKKKEDAPPDVGQEDTYEEKNRGKEKPEEVEDVQDDPEEIEIPVRKKSFSNKDTTVESLQSQLSNLEFEKVNTKIESLTALIKGYGERTSLINEQIGEIRAMNLQNEKSIAKMSAKAERAADIVMEVKPEKLRTDYQRLDVKIQETNGRIEESRQYNDSVMNELKDIRRRVGMLVGTDALLKLNDDVKQDLIATQQLAAKARMHADKSEQLFMEMKRGFAESQKSQELVSNIDKNYSWIDKDIKKLKMDMSSVVLLNDFNDFKKYIDTKFTDFEKMLMQINAVKEEQDKITKLIETTVKIAKQNQEDVGDIAMVIGDDHVKKVRDYETRISSILEIMDAFAEELKKIRKKLGMEHKGRLKIKKINKIFSKNLKNIELHPEAEKVLASPVQIHPSAEKLHKKSLKKIKMHRKFSKKLHKK